MKNVKRNTFSGRLSAAWRNFWRTLKGQTTSTINIGVQVNRCEDCRMDVKEGLKETEVARADLGKRLAAAQKELHEVKSELEKVKAERSEVHTDKVGMLIDRLREIARVMGLPRRRTLDQAADMLDNQHSEILALTQIVERQADTNGAVMRLVQEMHEAESELNRVKAERDYLYDIVEGTCAGCKHRDDCDWPCDLCMDDESRWEYAWEGK